MRCRNVHEVNHTLQGLAKNNNNKALIQLYMKNLYAAILMDLQRKKQISF